MVVRAGLLGVVCHFLSRCLCSALCVHGIDLGAGCICLDGWVGVHCDFLPCLNNATFANGQCQCTDRFTGFLCEHRCEHGSVVDGSCVCDQFHTGDRCEKALCQNGHWSPTEKKCQCEPAFAGRLCNRCALRAAALPDCRRFFTSYRGENDEQSLIYMVAAFSILVPFCVTTAVCYNSLKRQPCRTVTICCRPPYCVQSSIGYVTLNPISRSKSSIFACRT